MNPNSAVLFYRKIRQVIAYHLDLQVGEVFDGSVELDENYFGGQHMLFKTQSKRFYCLLLKEKIMTDSIVYTDGYKSYDVLDVSKFIHYRLNHSQMFTDYQNHINSIENFWNQAKRIL